MLHKDDTVRPITNDTSFHGTCSVIGQNSQVWAVIGSTAKLVPFWMDLGDSDFMRRLIEEIKTALLWNALKS